ncbi:unnamed protein product [Cunninghamella echinulata]
MEFDSFDVAKNHCISFSYESNFLFVTTDSRSGVYLKMGYRHHSKYHAARILANENSSDKDILNICNSGDNDSNDSQNPKECPANTFINYQKKG